MSLEPIVQSTDVEEETMMATAEERMKVLKLVEDGTVNPDEGAKLLAALGETTQDPEGPRPSGGGRWFRVRVTDTYTGRPKVNVNLPMVLVDMALHLGARFVPESEDLDLDEIKAAIRTGTTGKIVEVNDEEGGERVEIFVE